MEEYTPRFVEVHKPRQEKLIETHADLLRKKIHDLIPKEQRSEDIKKVVDELVRRWSNELRTHFQQRTLHDASEEDAEEWEKEQARLKYDHIATVSKRLIGEAFSADQARQQEQRELRKEIDEARQNENPGRVPAHLANTIHRLKNATNAFRGEA